MTTCLIIGSGAAAPVPFLSADERAAAVTLDLNGDHHPDVTHDLNDLPLPFADESFDKIVAVEVLEHVGRQGDWRFFFDQWSDFWRLLRPGGVFCGTCPSASSRWAWGDPGHTRIVSAESLTFLDQAQYAAQVGVTPMTDYRFCYRADFEVIHLTVDDDRTVFILRAIKPARVFSDERAP